MPCAEQRRSAVRWGPTDGIQPLVCTYTTLQRTRRHRLHVRPRSLTKRGDWVSRLFSSDSDSWSRGAYKHPRWRTVGWCWSAETNERRCTWFKFNKWLISPAPILRREKKETWQLWRIGCLIAIATNSATCVFISNNGRVWVLRAWRDSGNCVMPATDYHDCFPTAPFTVLC